MEVPDWVSILSFIIGLAIVIYVVVQTWRLSRSIGIGKAISVINTIFSPVFFFIQAIFLLRIYSRRTGIGLTFMMGDRMPAI